MRSFIFTRTKAAVFGWLFVLFLAAHSHAQTTAESKATKISAPPSVKVPLVDEAMLRKLMVPNGKPLLVNFWATWCDPCREEFPDLVKLDQEFKGKIDFITISLDDPADIATTVSRFLASMKAEMPAFLLKTADEGALITSVSKEWNGGMPFTILYDAKGTAVYEREGKVHFDIVRREIEKLVKTPPKPSAID